MGRLHRLQGRTARAEHFVERALAVNPSSIGALAELAEVKREQGELEESIRLYREAMAIDDSQPFLHLGLGDSLQRAGRLDRRTQAARPRFIQIGHGDYFPAASPACRRTVALGTWKRRDFSCEVGTLR